MLRAARDALPDPPVVEIPEYSSGRSPQRLDFALLATFNSLLTRVPYSGYPRV
jgi:hypothetical protein